MKSITQERSLGRAFLLFILLLIFLSLGLYLGGTAKDNKTKVLIEKLDETQDMLQKHPSSVIIIKSDIADAVEFKPRNKYDHDWRNR